MAKSRLVQPKGEKISVGPEERAFFKKQREEKGLEQKQLAVKVGASQSTISNLESGRHPQVNRATYAKLKQVLGTFEAGATSEALYKRIVDGLMLLNENNLATTADLVDSLKERQKPPEPAPSSPAKRRDN